MPDSKSAIKKVLVTGSAGFIGFHLFKQLKEHDYEIYGLDNLNDYYGIDLKKERLKHLGVNLNDLHFGNLAHNFYWQNLTDKAFLYEIFQKHQFDAVIHLAAQAGVRYSIEQPSKYLESNLIGFYNLLESCRKFGVKHFVFASSSSVYGNNTNVPFKETHNTDFPVSFYGATKKSNEVLAHSYAELYQIPMTGLRFFTVYGPWGRPDMAYYKFASKIMKSETIDVYNNGLLSRDFTYISDVVNGIENVLMYPPPYNYDANKSRSKYFNLFNIGRGKPEKLMHFIEILEKHLDKKAIKNFLPMQAGDVYTTYSDTSKLQNQFGYHPIVDLDEGLKNFANWFLEYHKFLG